MTRSWYVVFVAIVVASRLADSLSSCGGKDCCMWNSVSDNSTDTCAGNNAGLPKAVLSKLFSELPPFNLQESSNPICSEHSKTYIKQLEAFEMWALQMYDSTAKFPSGLLNGNVNQFGDFDQCLSVKQPEGEILGQYCLAYIEIKPTPGVNPQLLKLYDLIHAHNAFRSNLEDPGHRVPRFSSINWALCVPASCSPKDVEDSLYTTLQRVSATGLKLRVRVDPEMCQIRPESRIPPVSSLIVMGFFLCVISVIIAATVAESFVLDQAHASILTELLLAFSLQKNCRKLFSLSRTPDDIESIHGIRTINAFMLLMSHKSMALFFNPYSNRTAMTEMLGKPWTVIARAASLYTDPFIMLSGLLTSYAFCRQLKRTNTLDVPREYISRLMRLVPTLGALILFCTFVLPLLGSGPQWNLVVRHHAEICKNTWWRNFLFIHNYFGFKNMCLTHTHHIGIDTQLFAVSPILIWLVWRWPRQGLITLLGLGAVSTMLRFYATYVRQLNLFVFFGNPVSQMFDTADYSYILPTHRLTVYVMGIALGYGLHHWGRDYKLKTSHLTLGWFIAICMLYQSIVSPAKMGDRSYIYERMDAANYAAFAPITWCLFFCWIIFTSYTGNGGVLTRILTWRGFLICTRLSYSFYLTQFPVFFYNVGQTRSSEHYTMALLFNVKETIVIILASIVLTLMFEMPFQNIRAVLLRKQDSKKHTTQSKPLTAHQ